MSSETSMIVQTYAGSIEIATIEMYARKTCNNEILLFRSIPEMLNIEILPASSNQEPDFTSHLSDTNK